MSSFFLKTPASYLKSEIEARNNSISATKLKPWIRVRSNLGDGKVLSSTGYSSIFGGVYDSTLKPNPIITDFSIDFSSRGTLRKGTLKIECFSVAQYEEMQKYFMEPGISIFVQWGWNISASTGKRISIQAEDVDTQIGFYRKDDQLTAVRDKNNGCYDNMLGIITKAESSISNGEFTITTKIVTLGELLSGKSAKDPDTSTKPEDQVEGVRFSSDDVQEADDSYSPTLHWMYFWNSLPNDIRISKLAGSDALKIPEGIDESRDFINYDEEWMEEAKEETSDQFGEWNKFKFLTKTFEPKDKSSPIWEKKYIKFSALIILFNKLIETRTGKDGGNSSSQIKIGTKDNPYTLCGAFQRIFSINESVFIPNKESYNWFRDDPEFIASPSPKGGKGPNPIDNSVKSYTGEIISFPLANPTMTIEGKTYTFKPYQAGWIGDLYIEHDLAMQLLTETTTPIKDVLDGLLAEMSNAVDGMWNFQIVEATIDDKKCLLIADANLTNNGKGDAEFVPINLDAFGRNSSLLEGSFNFDIPKGMANQIVMAKSTPDGKSKQTGIRALFSNEEDKVLKAYIEQKKAEDSSESTTTQASDDEEEKAALWAGFRSRARILLQPTLSKLIKLTTNVETLEGYWIPGISTNKNAFVDTLQNNVKSEKGSFSGLLPIKINMTLLGISGFKFGDTFFLNGLPKKYSSGKNGFFQVTEVTHKVSNDLWTTEVEGMFRPHAKP